MDERTGDLSAYVLDEEAENSIHLTQHAIVVKIMPVNGAPFDLSLQAVENPLTGETAGNTSEFRGQADALRGAVKFAGIIAAVNMKEQDFKAVAFDFPEGNEYDNDTTSKKK